MTCFTVLDDHTVSDDLNDFVNSGMDYECDSELEVSEIQFETLEIGEMSQYYVRRRVSDQAWPFPCASNSGL